MEKRKILVILDDELSILKAYKRFINLLPEVKHIELAFFSTDSDAVKFVKENAEYIIGFIQDMSRPSVGQTGFAGIRFLNEVINTLTPWAKTVIASGQVYAEEIMELLYSAKYKIRFLAKPFDVSHFRINIQWLLESQVDTEDFLLNEAQLKDSKIIQLIKTPWEDVYRYIAENPSFLHSMDPRLFEELVADIFKRFGWDVELTAHTHDGGYDIIAIKQNDPTCQRILIEAKRYAPNRVVGVEIVRSIYGLRSLHAASQVVLATSSYISDVAKKEFLRVIPWELDFIERDRILDWCRQYGGVSLDGSLK